MAGSSLREGSPRGRTAAGTGGAADVLPAIVVLLALGLFLRVIIAYVLLPGSGFPVDLNAFQYWANDIAQHGPVGFYERQGFIDYPPVYLALLAVISFVMGGSIGEGIKLIPMLADLGLAALVYYMAVELGASTWRATIVAVVILVNPITWINSAIWGQADAVGSIFLLLGLRELLKDRRETAAALAVVSVLTKMQLGILAVLVGVVILRRSLFPKEGEADPMRVLTSLGAGLLTAGLICLPFTGLDFGGYVSRLGTYAGALTLLAGVVAAAGVAALAWRYLPIAESAYRAAVAGVAALVTVVLSGAMVFNAIVSHLASAFGEYPYLTLNAYNPWALLQTADGQGMATSKSWLRDISYIDPQLGPQPWYGIGHFSAAWILVIAVAIAALALGAFLAWGAARRREAALPAESDDARSEDTPAARESGSGAAWVGGWRERHDWVEELRSLAAVFVVTAVVLAALLVIQPFGPIPAAIFGDVLLVLVLVSAAFWAAWRDDALSLLVALTIMAIAFFVVPTRVHERYLFPFFGLGALLFAVSWRWRIAYVLLAVVNSANLVAVLVQYKGVPLTDGWAATTLNDWGTYLLNSQLSGLVWPITVSAVVTGAVMFWALMQMRGMASNSLELEAEGAGEEESGSWFISWFAPRMDDEPPAAGARAIPQVPASTGRASVAAGATSASTTGPSAASDSETAPYEEPLESEEPEGSEDWAYSDELDEEYEDESRRPVYVPRSVMRVWRRFAGPSSYPDRSPALDSEPHGRIDKLDIWVVVALVAAILCLRIYRLGEPRQMYFDEVYHARSATEFLQDWRYGIPHDIPGNYIYEWTHPMLAKYAIAGGITVFSDDKVTATNDLNVPVTDAYVEPRLEASPLANTGANDAFSNADNRFGDRVFVATGSQVRVFDLQTRASEWTYDIPGATTFASPGDATGVLYVGTAQGRIWRLDLNSLDGARLGVGSVAPATELSVNTGIDIAHLYAGTPPFILAADSGGNIVSVDLTQDGGTVVGQGNVPGAADFADLGTAPQTLDVLGSKVTDASAEAQQLASLIGGNAAEIESAIRSAPPNISRPLPVGSLASAQASAVQTAISQGSLPGISLQTTNPEVLVAYKSGLGLLDARHVVLTTKDKDGNPIPAISTSQPVTSIAINPDSVNSNGSDSYAAAGNSILLFRPSTTGGTGTVAADGSQPLRAMPGAITKVMWDRATHVAQALGKTQDGSGWTVYAIEGNGNAFFSDAKLPFEPAAIGLDSTLRLPDTDREQVLAFSSTGSMASVDVGQFAFSWRIVGVLFGALMAACLYLLVRILFRRRTVGLLVALFSLIDGMFFAQSRIAMNDTYVGGFLLLAYLLFALMWLVWKRRAAFWLGMPLLGVILGLALASKWVAFYAMASIGILILIRSALGRLVTILGLAAGTGVLGWQAIAEMTTAPNTGSPPMVIALIFLALVVAVVGAYWTTSQRTTPDKVFTGIVTAVIAALLVGAALTFTPASIDNGAPNYTFFLIMLGITALAAAGNAYRPVAWTREELWFATVGVGAAGVIVAVLGFAFEHGFLSGLLSGFISAQGHKMLLGGLGLVALGIVARVVFQGVGLLGFGPLAKAPGEKDYARFAAPPSPAPEGWLRLGSGYGLPALWMTFCVMLLPIVVYVLFYIPWAMPWQTQTAATGPLPAIACWHTAPDPTNSLATICTDAWPAGHTGQTLWDLTIQMYNYHNNLRAAHAASSPWWAWPMDLKPVWFESIGYAGDNTSMIYDGGNPVLWWVAIGAMGFICWQAYKRRNLGLALIVIAFLWQWISWSRIDRAAFQYHFYTALPFFLAALAYFLAEIWHGPSRRTWLLARGSAVAACLFPGVMWLLKPELCGLARVDTTQYFQNTVCGTGTGNVVIETRLFLIGVVLVVALAVLAVILWRLERRQDRGYEDPYWALQLVVPVAIAGALLWVIGQNGPRTTLFQAALPSDYLAIVFVAFGVVLAIVAAIGTNPRRFVVGVIVFAILAFAALYPNLSALPMPQAITGIYNSLLPTWLYGFQFSDNLQESQGVGLVTSATVTVTVFVLALAGIASWVAWERRLVVGYRRAQLSAGQSDSSDALEAGYAELAPHSDPPSNAEATPDSEPPSQS